MISGTILDLLYKTKTRIGDLLTHSAASLPTIISNYNTNGSYRDGAYIKIRVDIDDVSYAMRNSNIWHLVLAGIMGNALEPGDYEDIEVSIPRAILNEYVVSDVNAPYGYTADNNKKFYAFTNAASEPDYYEQDNDTYKFFAKQVANANHGLDSDTAVANFSMRIVTAAPSDFFELSSVYGGSGVFDTFSDYFRPNGSFVMYSTTRYANDMMLVTYYPRIFDKSSTTNNMLEYVMKNDMFFSNVYLRDVDYGNDMGIFNPGAFVNYGFILSGYTSKMYSVSGCSSYVDFPITNVIRSTTLSGRMGRTTMDLISFFDDNYAQYIAGMVGKYLDYSSGHFFKYSYMFVSGYPYSIVSAFDNNVMTATKNVQNSFKAPFSYNHVDGIYGNFQNIHLSIAYGSLSGDLSYYNNESYDFLSFMLEHYPIPNAHIPLSSWNKSRVISLQYIRNNLASYKDYNFLVSGAGDNDSQFSYDTVFNKMYGETTLVEQKPMYLFNIRMFRSNVLYHSSLFSRSSIIPQMFTNYRRYIIMDKLYNGTFFSNDNVFVDYYNKTNDILITKKDILARNSQFLFSDAFDYYTYTQRNGIYPNYDTLYSTYSSFLNNNSYSLLLLSPLSLNAQYPQNNNGTIAPFSNIKWNTGNVNGSWVRFTGYHDYFFFMPATPPPYLTLNNEYFQINQSWRLNQFDDLLVKIFSPYNTYYTHSNKTNKTQFANQYLYIVDNHIDDFAHLDMNNLFWRFNYNNAYYRQNLFEEHVDFLNVTTFNSGYDPLSNRNPRLFLPVQPFSPPNVTHINVDQLYDGFITYVVDPTLYANYVSSVSQFLSSNNLVERALATFALQDFLTYHSIDYNSKTSDYFRAMSGFSEYNMPFYFSYYNRAVFSNNVLQALPGTYDLLSGVGIKDMKVAFVKDLDYPLFSIMHSVFMPVTYSGIMRYSYFSEKKVTVYPIYSGILFDNMDRTRIELTKYYDTSSTCTTADQNIEFYIDNALHIASEQGIQYKNHQYYSFFAPRIYPRAFMAYYTPTVNRSNPEYVPTNLVRYAEKVLRIKKRAYKFNKSTSDGFISVVPINIYDCVRQLVYDTSTKAKVIQLSSYPDKVKTFGVIYAIRSQNGLDKVVLDVYVLSSKHYVVPIFASLKNRRTDLHEIYLKHYRDKPFEFFRDMIHYHENFINAVIKQEANDFMHPVEKGFKLGSALWDIKFLEIYDGNQILISENSVSNFSHYFYHKYVSLVEHIFDDIKNVCSEYNIDAEYDKIVSDVINSMSVKIVVRKNTQHTQTSWTNKAGLAEAFYVKYKNNSYLKRFVGHRGKIDNREYFVNIQKTYAPVVTTGNPMSYGKFGYILHNAQTAQNNNIITSYRPNKSYAVYTDKKYDTDRSNQYSSEYTRIIDRVVFQLESDVAYTRKMLVKDHNILGTEAAISNNDASTNDVGYLISMNQAKVSNSFTHNTDRSKEPLFLVQNLENSKSFVMLFTKNRSKNPYAGFHYMHKSMSISSMMYNFMSLDAIRGIPNTQILANHYTQTLGWFISKLGNNYNYPLVKRIGTGLLDFRNDTPITVTANIMNPIAPFVQDYKTVMPNVYAKIMMPRLPMYISQRFYTDELRGFVVKKIKSIEYTPRAERKTILQNYTFTLSDDWKQRNQDVFQFISQNNDERFFEKYTNITPLRVNNGEFEHIRDYYASYHINDFAIKEVEEVGRVYGRIPFPKTNQVLATDSLFYAFYRERTEDDTYVLNNYIPITHRHDGNKMLKYVNINNSTDPSFNVIYNNIQRIDRSSFSYEMQSNSVVLANSGLVEPYNMNALVLFANFVPMFPIFEEVGVNDYDYHGIENLHNNTLVVRNGWRFGEPPIGFPLGSSRFVQSYLVTQYPMVYSKYADETYEPIVDVLRHYMPMEHMFCHQLFTLFINTEPLKQNVGNGQLSNSITEFYPYAFLNTIFETKNRYNVFAPQAQSYVFIVHPFKQKFRAHLEQMRDRHGKNRVSILDPNQNQQIYSKAFALSQTFVTDTINYPSVNIQVLSSLNRNDVLYHGGIFDYSPQQITKIKKFLLSGCYAVFINTNVENTEENSTNTGSSFISSFLSFSKTGINTSALVQVPSPYVYDCNKRIDLLRFYTESFFSLDKITVSTSYYKKISLQIGVNIGNNIFESGSTTTTEIETPVVTSLSRLNKASYEFMAPGCILLNDLSSGIKQSFINPFSQFAEKDYDVYSQFYIFASHPTARYSLDFHYFLTDEVDERLFDTVFGQGTYTEASFKEAVDRKTFKEHYYMGAPFGGKSLLLAQSDTYFIYNCIIDLFEAGYYSDWDYSVSEIELPLGEDAYASIGIIPIGTDITFGYYMSPVGSIIARNYSSKWDKYYGEYALPTMTKVNVNNNWNDIFAFANSPVLYSYHALDAMPPIRTGYMFDDNGDYKEMHAVPLNYMMSREVHQKHTVKGNQRLIDKSLGQMIYYLYFSGNKTYKDYFEEMIQKIKHLGNFRGTRNALSNWLGTVSPSFKVIYETHDLFDIAKNNMLIKNTLTASDFNYFSYYYYKWNSNVKNEYLYKLYKSLSNVLPHQFKRLVYDIIHDANAVDMVINKLSFISDPISSALYYDVRSYINHMSYDLSQGDNAILDDTDGWVGTNKLFTIGKHLYRVADSVVTGFHFPNLPLYGFENNKSQTGTYIEIYKQTLSPYSTSTADDASRYKKYLKSVLENNYIVPWLKPNNLTTDNEFIYNMLDSYTLNIVNADDYDNNKIDISPRFYTKFRPSIYTTSEFISPGTYLPFVDNNIQEPNRYRVNPSLFFVNHSFQQTMFNRPVYMYYNFDEKSRWLGISSDNSVDAVIKATNISGLLANRMYFVYFNSFDFIQYKYYGYFSPSLSIYTGYVPNEVYRVSYELHTYSDGSCPPVNNTNHQLIPVTNSSNIFQDSSRSNISVSLWAFTSHKSTPFIHNISTNPLYLSESSYSLLLYRSKISFGLSEPIANIYAAPENILNQHVALSSIKLIYHDLNLTDTIIYHDLLCYKSFVKYYIIYDTLQPTSLISVLYDDTCGVIIQSLSEPKIIPQSKLQFIRTTTFSTIQDNIIKDISIILNYALGRRASSKIHGQIADSESIFDYIPRFVYYRYNPAYMGTNHPNLGLVSMYYFFYPQTFLTRTYSLFNMLDPWGYDAGANVLKHGHIITHGGYPWYEAQIFDYILCNGFAYKAVDVQTDKEELYVFACPHPNYVLFSDDGYYKMKRGTDNVIEEYMPDMLYTAPPFYGIKKVEYTYQNRQVSLRPGQKYIKYRDESTATVSFESMFEMLCFPQISFPANFITDHDFDYEYSWTHNTNGGVYACFTEPTIKSMVVQTNVA